MIELYTMAAFMIFGAVSCFLAAKSFVGYMESSSSGEKVALLAAVLFNLGLLAFTSLASVGLFLQAMAYAA